MIGRRIVFVFLLVCSFVALGSLSAQQKHASRIGWISDEGCGAKHTKAGGADCVQKCWRGGASVGHPEWKPQRAVFVADDDQGIWIVENPEAVRNFPAAHRRSPPLRSWVVQNARQILIRRLTGQLEIALRSTISLFPAPQVHKQVHKQFSRRRTVPRV